MAHRLFVAGLFRFRDLKEGHVDHRVFMHQCGADDLLALIAVIPSIAYGVERILCAFKDLLQKRVRFF